MTTKLRFASRQAIIATGVSRLRWNGHGLAGRVSGPERARERKGLPQKLPVGQAGFAVYDGDVFGKSECAVEEARCDVALVVVKQRARRW